MEAKPSRGRPRDPDTEQAVMSAVRRLLARDGYDRMSITAIAREANVSRPAVYRRWPSKAHVLFDAVFDVAVSVDALAGSGDFESDLRAFVRGLFEFRQLPGIADATRGILVERHRDSDERAGIDQLSTEGEARAAFGTLVGRGIEQGVVAADADIEMAYDLLVGASINIAHARLVDDLDDAADRLSSLLLQGLVSRG